MSSDGAIARLSPLVETARVQAGDIELAYWRTGRGTPVLCLHAAGHSSRDFADLARRLGSRFEFIAVDWPGQGDSPPECTPASAARYAQLVADLVESLQLERLVLLGNSIGGAAAIEFAAKHPERVRALVLCNPGGLQAIGLLARLVCRLKARFFERGERGDPGFLARYRRYYERTVLPTLAATGRREEIIRSGLQTARVLRQAWESFGRPSADIRHLVPKLTCPVLYAWASGDRLVSWGRSKRAALTAKRHTVALLKGGHCAFLETPEEFDRIFCEFSAALPA